ncbi:hypothetical protein [Viscerimonas tarda]
MEEANTFYQENLKLLDIPKEFTDFFPSKVKVSGEIEGSYDATNGCIYYIIFEYDRKNVIDSLKNKYEKIAIASYCSSDSNTIVVKTMEIRGKQHDYILYHDTIYDNRIYYPIPYFEKSEPFRVGDVSTPTNIYSDSTKCGLSKDFTIYVLNSKVGIYNENLRPLHYMPEGWKNGYSKGVCINEKKGIMVYWVLVW